MDAVMDPELLREEFLKLLTEDSETKDRRRREYNQAIFIPMDGELFQGRQIWSTIDLGMVLDKFDKAVKNMRRA